VGAHARASVIVNGLAVAASGSVLEACLAAGVYVPHFCWDERLSPGGHCRSCIVEADGRCVAACTTPTRGGMEVRTDTARLVAYRRDLGELMVAESAPAGEVAERLADWGVDGTRYPSLAARERDAGGEGSGDAPGRRDASHPYLRIDLDACILCRRCVRACEEIQGQFVYAVAGRGASSRITWSGGEFARSGCVSCGACVTACPTGAISDVDRLSHEPVTHTARTTCAYCGVGCQLDVRVAHDRVVRIDGVAESPVNHGHLCVKGRYAHAFARHPDRLTTPLVRRGDRLEPASWGEAIATVARELESRRGHVAGLSSSRCTNEENYLFQKWMRTGLGTNDVDCCARVCHAPSAAGMRQSLGTGAATNSLADIERADLLMVVGSNMTEAHPVTGARVRQAALRGAGLVVVDPRRTELAAMADIHLQLRPGTNVPLFNSLAAVLVEEGLVNLDFVAARTEGWDGYQTFILAQTPERWEPVTGVPAASVREAARLYGRASAPMMMHGLGVTEHFQGSEGVMLLCNLALLVGAVGREGVGVNPLRGQNNVQGAADMGCQPDLLTGYAPVADVATRARFEEIWGRPVPDREGRILPRMYDAALAGEITAMVLLGEDVIQTDPDQGRTRRALESLEFLLVQEIFLSETARLADVVLPGASFLEKEGTFTNGERRVQRVRRAIDPPGEARPDWRILLDLMAATGCPQSFRDPADILEEVGRVAPSFAGIRLDRLEEGGIQWPSTARDHPGTATLHATSFPRPGGRGRFTRIEYLPSPSLGGADAAEDVLTLTTGRVLEHYNSGSMTRRTRNLELCDRDDLEIHPRDAHRRGIADGDPVTVASANGEAHAFARVTDRVAPGVVFLSFHFPETRANAVTSEVLDRLSGCPEYKVAAVRVRRGA
jgi:formate dehydrogenase major subunit